MHEVVLCWLRAERLGHLTTAIGAAQIAKQAHLLDAPKLQDADENWWRLRWLFLTRSRFVVEIPPDTVWYRVNNLEHADLDELHSVAHADWSDPNDNNELRKVAARKKLKMNLPPYQWEEPILWGHTKAGPFTILEGNHRLAAYAGSGQTNLDVPIYVGLSPLRCVWHILDNPNWVLLQDMMR